jgi:hypothetical protein
MGATLAWQSVLQQLQDLSELAIRRQQHVMQGNAEAAATAAADMDFACQLLC